VMEPDVDLSAAGWDPIDWPDSDEEADKEAHAVARILDTDSATSTILRQYGMDYDAPSIQVPVTAPRNEKMIDHQKEAQSLPAEIETTRREDYKLKLEQIQLQRERIQLRRFELEMEERKRRDDYERERERERHAIALRFLAGGASFGGLASESPGPGA